MKALAHPVFGEVKVDSDDGIDWSGERSLHGHVVTVDLTLPGGETNPGACLDKVAPFVKDLAAFDANAREALGQDYEEGPDSAVGGYLDHHLDELDPKVITKIFGVVPEAVDLHAFLRAARLARVGLYPSELDRCAVFDYTIGKDVTQYVLSVAFDGEGEVTSIDMES